MSTRKDDIEALLEDSKKLLAKLEIEYQLSLEKQLITASLKNNTLYLTCALRASLDYLAQDMHEKYSTNSKPQEIHFPILDKLEKFNEKIKKFYPQLEKKSPELYTYLLHIQPFLNPTNLWLKEFQRINNYYKHRRLIPHIPKTNRSQIKGTFNLGETYTINLNGENQNKIQIQKVDGSIETKIIPSNYYLANSNIDNSITPTTQSQLDIFIDFEFEDLPNIPALTLLKQSHQGIQQIYTDISKWLY